MEILLLAYLIPLFSLNIIIYFLDVNEEIKNDLNFYSIIPVLNNILLGIILASYMNGLLDKIFKGK